MDVKARVSSGDDLLNEKFTIPSIITTPNPIDFNTFTTPGIYYVGSRNADNTGNNLKNNGPIDSFGTLFVSGKGGTLFQVFITDSESEMYHRHVDNDLSTDTNFVWKDWVKMVDKKTTLDKAFQVGFGYLTVYANPVLPSFGAWSIKPYETLSYVSSSALKIFEIYQVTRTA